MSNIFGTPSRVTCLRISVRLFYSSTHWIACSGVFLICGLGLSIVYVISQPRRSEGAVLIDVSKAFDTVLCIEPRHEAHLVQH